VRATTAFNKMLAIPGADVAGVVFTPTGIVVGLRRRGRRLHCPCGWSTRAVYDRATRRWRDLDLGAARLYLEAEIRRLTCRACGRVRTQTVPWARQQPGSLATSKTSLPTWPSTDKTTITRLLRCSWEAVAAITVRVVATHLDDARLEGLDRIGIDEVSYRKGRRCLTVVADHDRAGAVVWAGEGRSSATLERFFDTLGPDRAARLVAAWMDLHGADAKVTRARPPGQGVRRPLPHHQAGQRRHRRSPPGCLEHHPPRRRRRPSWPAGRVGQDPAAQLVKNTRWALLKDPASWTDSQRQTITQLRRARHVLFRAWVLKEELRDLYRLPTDRRPDAHLDAWLARASRCRIRPCSTCRAPSAATATRSWPPSSWACPTPSWKGSTARSA
jgi:transposase